MSHKEVQSEKVKSNDNNHIKAFLQFHAYYYATSKARDCSSAATVYLTRGFSLHMQLVCGQVHLNILTAQHTII